MQLALGVCARHIMTNAAQPRGFPASQRHLFSDTNVDKVRHLFFEHEEHPSKPTPPSCVAWPSYETPKDRRGHACSALLLTPAKRAHDGCPSPADGGERRSPCEISPRPRTPVGSATEQRGWLPFRDEIARLEHGYAVE